MVFKIHELHGMERSFSKYEKETERLCLHDTQALVISGKSPVRLFIGNGVDFLPILKKKKKKRAEGCAFGRLCFKKITNYLFTFSF